jgi:hypothetical protein
VAIGLSTRRRRTVSLEEGASPGGARCPADGEPLFVWIETYGYGKREDEVVDRCEACGLAVPRDSVPSPDRAVDELLGRAEWHGERIAVRTANAASLQAWLGAENWAALAPGDPDIKPTPRAARLLFAKRGLQVRRIRHLARGGIATMWQTLLNLLTFHRDFAPQVISGELRPGTGRGVAPFWIDAAITLMAAIPTALVAVLLEAGAVLARRGGVIEIQAERLPATE